jgi:GNAT superfamily N-acetyltransferase
MEYTIRPFSEKDSQGVRELILSILTKEYPFDKTAYSDSDLDTIHEVYGGARESFFVGEEAGFIVGTVGIKEEEKDSALLRRLFVSPDHRRKGIGSGLLARALEFCRSRGYKQVIFRCTDRMGDAIHLCEKNGFKVAESLDMGGFKIHKLTLTMG